MRQAASNTSGAPNPGRSSRMELTPFRGHPILLVRKESMDDAEESCAGVLEGFWELGYVLNRPRVPYRLSEPCNSLSSPALRVAWFLPWRRGCWPARACC